MVALTTTRTPSWVSRWEQPVPAARVWMAGLHVWPTPGSDSGWADLHRIEHWNRAADGRIYARCGASSTFWLEPHPVRAAERSRCPHCKDDQDSEDTTPAES